MDTWLHLAYCLMDLGKDSSALQCFQQVKKILSSQLIRRDSYYIQYYNNVTKEVDDQLHKLQSRMHQDGTASPLSTEEETLNALLQKSDADTKDEEEDEERDPATL